MCIRDSAMRIMTTPRTMSMDASRVFCGSGSAAMARGSRCGIVVVTVMAAVRRLGTLSLWRGGVGYATHHPLAAPGVQGTVDGPLAPPDHPRHAFPPASAHW